MNRPKEQRMIPMIQEGAVRMPASRERGAVVKGYKGAQLMSQEAMLPMPPHNTARSSGHLMRGTRQWLTHWQGLLRLLKRRA